MPFIPSFSLKPPLKSYHDMGFFLLQPRLLPIFRIYFMSVRETSSPRNPPHKTINTAAARHDISLFRIFTCPFHSTSHTTNRAFAISLVTPKSCFLINRIRILYNHIYFSNHGPRLGHAVSVNFLPPLAKMVSPIYNTPDQYILAHAVWAFVILSHCICTTYNHFPRYTLKVTHENPINTSPFNR